MKFLLVVLVLGFLALASAIPVYNDEFDNAEDDSLIYADGGGRIGERLKELFENILEKMKKAVENGKGVREDFLKKADDVYQKLKNLGVELGDKIKETFEDLRSKLSKQGASGIGDRLKQIFENIVEKMKEAVESGKGVKEDFLKKADDVYQKLKNLGVELGDKLEETFEDLRSKLGKQGSVSEFENVQASGIGDRLKEIFENIIEKMKEAVENGKGVKEDFLKKADDVYQKLKNLGVDLGDKLKEAFEDLRSKLGKQGSVSEFENVQASGIGDRLKEIFENIVEKMKEAVENGKGVREDFLKKADDVYQKLKNLGVELGDKLKEAFEDLRSKLRKEAPAIDFDDEFVHSDGGGKIGEKLREMFERIIEKMKEAVENGKGVGENFMKKADDLYQKLKNMGVDLGEKIKTAFEDLRSKLKKESSTIDIDYELSHADDGGRIGQRLRDLFQRIIDRMKKAIDEGKTLRPNFLKKADDVFEKLKNLGLNDKLKEIFENLRSKLSRQGSSIKDVYEKIRDYFRELNIELKERFTKFGQWVKEQYQNGLDKTKTKAENIKKIAKDFLDDSRKIRKDVAGEALEFFREYKKDLGLVYDDVVEKVREIVNT